MIAFEFAKRWRASSISASAVIAPPINALKNNTAFVDLIRRTIPILKTHTIDLQYESDAEDTESSSRTGVAREGAFASPEFAASTAVSTPTRHAGSVRADPVADQSDRRVRFRESAGPDRELMLHSCRDK